MKINKYIKQILKEEQAEEHIEEKAKEEHVVKEKKEVKHAGGFFRMINMFFLTRCSMFNILF